MMSNGLDTEPCSEGGRNLGFTFDGAVLSLRGVDFGASPGASAVTLRTATPLAGGSVTVLLDGVPAGPPCAVPSTGDWQVFTSVTCPLTLGRATGIATNLSFVFNGRPDGKGLFNLAWWTFLGGVASGEAPPPVTVALALRSVATDLYACAAADAGAVVTPSGAAPCAWTLHDLEDGTYALGTPSASGERFACIGAGAGAALAATAMSPDAPCARFWLYGTPVGSYAFLSAGAGTFLTATAVPSAAVGAGSIDPRLTPNDGARFFVEVL